jgi:hypothetical protein
MGDDRTERVNVFQKPLCGKIRIESVTKTVENVDDPWSSLAVPVPFAW